MNTFASLLLAFPFYLALKGKLSVYVDFSKPGKTADAQSAGANQDVATGTAPSSANSSAADTSASGSSMGDFASNVATFQTIAGLFG